MELKTRGVFASSEQQKSWNCFHEMRQKTICVLPPGVNFGELENAYCQNDSGANFKTKTFKMAANKMFENF
jgi:hypothetical protein